MMSYCLVQLTSKDYRNFRKAYSQIRYSFSEKGKGNKRAEELSSQIATEVSTRTKGEFLNDLGNPNREMYFFQSEAEILGYVELVFNEKLCWIHEFVVFEKEKGLGSILFEETKSIIKEKGCLKIELWCPFEGAQIFWKKKGFKPFYRNQKLYFQKKVR